MEQKSLTLKQQALQAQYEMSRLQKNFGLEKKNTKWVSRVRHNSK